ncbi:hypothetical protein OEZ86_012537 [Tetradesmus obliquus]|nr:hypothetical protein OEZ86_012537 [Tetradesmus obliquus]
MDRRARPANAAGGSGSFFGWEGSADAGITTGGKGHGAQAGAPQVAPFAVAEAPSDVYPSDFHLVTRMKQEVTGKAGADGFDSRVYLANRLENKTNMSESKTRNYSGAGTPYAMHDVDQASMYTRNGHSFHMQEPGKQMAEKIGAATTFDAEVYRQSILDHAQQQQASKQRNCGSGAGAAGGGSCPFATSDEFKQQWQREDYHPKAAGKAFADKVGSERTFDAGVYSKAAEVNRQQQAASSQRNFVGGGDILAFQP